MDDFVYLESMERAFDNCLKNNLELDSKAYQMIAAIGVMFTIQSTVLIYLNSHFNFNLINILILFFSISSLIEYFFSIVNFISVIDVKSFKSLPSSNAIVDYYEKEYNKEKYIATMLGNYQDVINNNEGIVSDKGLKSVQGFHDFKFGLLFFFISIIFIVMGVFI